MSDSITVMNLSFRTDRSGANSADPDQSAPRGAVWSGSSLFAILFVSLDKIFYGLASLFEF